MNTQTINSEKKNLQRLINLVDKIPALPHIVQSALQVIDDPNSTAKTVAEIISKDVILAGRILRIANSAFFGFPRRIKSMHDAIVILGFDTVKNLVIAATIHKFNNKHRVSGYGVKSGELWRHSIGCALCSQMIAQEIGQDVDEAFIAGLMHDVGKVALDYLMVEESKKVLELVIEKNMSFSNAEMSVLGYDHSQIGTKISIKWNLPKSIVSAIEYHHKPLALKKNPELAAIVRLSDAICLMYGVGIGGEELDIEKDLSILKILNLDKKTASNLIDDIGNKIHSMIAQVK